MSEPASPALSSPQRPLFRGVVLLADDEEAIRWVGRRLLEADGWKVLEAADGEQGLEILRTLEAG